ncbi:MAG: SanA/YdcF family protein [Prochlorotrichaceae cyanobacterium]
MILKSIPLSKLPWRKLFWGGVLLSFMVPAIAWEYIQRSSQSKLYQTPTEVPPQRVAIVFGASVWSDGTPSPMLADRIEGAVSLYQAGLVSKILMTGDNSSEHYNEVVAMENYAIQQGVPAADITLDYAGFSTYESCYRANVIFGVKSAILVTQQFHIARAVYTCHHLGLEAIGLGTPDWERYGGIAMRPVVVREMLACVKALLELHLLHPKPTFLGKFEGLR